MVKSRRAFACGMERDGDHDRADQQKRRNHTREIGNQHICERASGTLHKVELQRLHERFKHGIFIISCCAQRKGRVRMTERWMGERRPMTRGTVERVMDRDGRVARRTDRTTAFKLASTAEAIVRKKNIEKIGKVHGAVEKQREALLVIQWIQ